tara:strand:+ start:995 stop:1732 length:738 start_codon:yes stop_codon:yes gene_type:complete
MLVEEHKTDLQVDVPTMLCDSVICDKIHPSLPNKSFVMLIVADKGGGKTSLVTSLLTSKKKNSKAYRGKFEDIMLNIPKSSLKSIKGGPFDDLPSENVFEEFDDEFLDAVLEKAEENSAEDFKTLVVVDDASSKLKNSKSIIDKLTSIVHKHRHLKLSLMILVQSLTSVPLPIRKNADTIVYFKPVNEKSNIIFKDEFLGSFSRDEARMLFEYVFREKGDFLMVRVEAPVVNYYRKFNKLLISRE